MEQKLLQVGDKIQIDTRIFKPWVSTIIRVTKTKAIGDIPGNPHAQMEFRRTYTDPDFIRPFKYIKWNTNSYTLLIDKESNDEEKSL